MPLPLPPTRGSLFGGERGTTEEAEAAAAAAAAVAAGPDAAVRSNFRGEATTAAEPLLFNLFISAAAGDFVGDSLDV